MLYLCCLTFTVNPIPKDHHHRSIFHSLDYYDYEENTHTRIVFSLHLNIYHHQVVLKKEKCYTSLKCWNLEQSCCKIIRLLPLSCMNGVYAMKREGERELLPVN